MSHCFACDTNYSGSVMYDGMNIFVVRYATGVTLMKSLVDFTSAKYTHCQLLNELVQQHPSILCPSVLPERLLTFPRWFFHTDDMNERNLNMLSAAVIYTAASSLPYVTL